MTGSNVHIHCSGDFIIDFELIFANCEKKYFRTCLPCPFCTGATPILRGRYAQDVYLGPYQISAMELFLKIVFVIESIFTKSSIIADEVSENTSPWITFHLKM